MGISKMTDHLNSTDSQQKDSVEIMDHSKWIIKLRTNDSFSDVPLQTAFRLNGSPFGFNDKDRIKHTAQQNQMLPIYCSIMGLIIVFLSIYVIYKLWKQREAIKNTKLSDVESMISTVNGTAGKSSDRARRWPSSAACMQTSTRIDHLHKSSPSNTTGQYSPLPSNGRNRQEIRPLLDNNLGSTDHESGGKKLQLEECPVDVLGTLCCQCSKVDFEKLISALDLRMDSVSESEWTNSHDSLLQTALQEYKLYSATHSSSPSRTEMEKLEKSCQLMIYLCTNSSNRPITLGFFSDLIMQVPRNSIGEDSNVLGEQIDNSIKHTV